jgi:hypothetical protein
MPKSDLQRHSFSPYVPAKANKVNSFRAFNRDCPYLKSSRRLSPERI